MVAASWGLLYWGEGQHAGPRAIGYITALFVLYAVGIVLICVS